MKKLAFVLLSAIVFTSIHCNKTTTDDPPTPTEGDYTIKYTVVSTGDVIVDTIIYLDSDGTEKTLLDQKQFDHSFVQPANNYHGKLHLSGTTNNNGKCSYSLEIIEKDGAMANVDADISQTPSLTHFSFSSEFSSSGK